MSEKQYYKLTDISPNDAKNPELEYVCDYCKKSFKQKDVLLEIANNVMFGNVFVKQIRKDDNIYYLVSPCCKSTHLFGFDLANKSNIKNSTH